MKNKMTLGDFIKNYRKKHSMSMDDFSRISGISKSYISVLEKNRHPTTNKPITPSITLIKQVADCVDMSFNELFNLLDCDVDISIENQNTDDDLPAPTVTEETVTFPVIGEVAAGYDKIAVEDWTGETVEIPLSYLKGHKRDEFFVLSVKGDSMYPLYHNNDKVLILKQSSLDRSGDIGIVQYGDCGTLKKVEFVMGEDWMKLIPINPNFPPVLVEGVDLEQCCVLGVPKLLIREL